MQVRARRASGLETEAPHCTLFQLPSGKGQPRAAPHPDLAGRGQRPSSLRRPGPRGGVTAPDPGARPPPGQISSWRGAPPTRTWDPAAISGRCLRPQSVPGLRTAPPGRSPWVGLVLWDPLSRARSRASRPKTPRRGPCRVTEAPRRGVPSPPQRPRDGRRGRTSSREGPGAPPPRAALSSESLPAPGHKGADLGLARPGPASSRSAASLRRRSPHLRRDPRQAPGAARPAAPGALPGPRPRDPHLPPPRPAPCGSRSALPFPRPPLLLAPLPLLLPREAGSPLGPPPAARRLGPLPSRTRGEFQAPAAAPALPRAPRAAPVGERVGWVRSGGGGRPATPRARGESLASGVRPSGPISCVHP